nr:MAG: DNA polymerase elongation subunit, family B [Candidatus Nanosalinarum sp. J07AB56]
MLKRENLREHLDGFLENVNSTLPEFMELEFEGYFERGFFTSTGEGRGAKKKYALLNEEGELKIVGFEQVRRDWAPIAKNLQRKVLEKVLNRRSDEAASLVMDTVERLKDGEVPVEELRIYSTLTKSPKNTTPPLRTSRQSRRRATRATTSSQRPQSATS